MDVIDAMHRRRSTRRFEPEGLLLPRELIEELIEDATLAPSDLDLQPWRFVVVRDRERKEILYQCAMRQEILRDAAAVVIVCGDLCGSEGATRVADAWARTGVVRPEDAGKVAASIRATYADNDRARWLLASRGPCFASMSLMLLALERGIATTPVVTFNDEAVRRAFSIGDRFLPLVLLAMGMPSTFDAQPPRVPRVPLSEIVYHEDMGAVPASAR